jgi:hypothetical protein
MAELVATAIAAARVDRRSSGMQLTTLRILIGIAVIAGSFWVTLLVLDHAAGPPSGGAPEPAVTSGAPAPAPAPSPPSPPAAPTWNEALYLAVNGDVATAVARKDFKSGREHYELAGRAERRQGGFVPADWDEGQYLRANPDVAAAVSAGTFLSGYHHYLVAGRNEGRRGGFPPGRPPDK